MLITYRYHISGISLHFLVIGFLTCFNCSSPPSIRVNTVSIEQDPDSKTLSPNNLEKIRLRGPENKGISSKYLEGIFFESHDANLPH